MIRSFFWLCWKNRGVCLCFFSMRKLRRWECRRIPFRYNANAEMRVQHGIVLYGAFVEKGCIKAFGNNASINGWKVPWEILPGLVIKNGGCECSCRQARFHTEEGNLITRTAKHRMASSVWGQLSSILVQNRLSRESWHKILSINWVA